MQKTHYHFHKDCIHYPDCIEKEDKIGKHKVIRFWCPELSRARHEMTGVHKCKKFNYGEEYDRYGGQAYYPRDLHSIKTDCPYFEGYQNQLDLR